MSTLIANLISLSAVAVLVAISLLGGVQSHLIAGQSSLLVLALLALFLQWLVFVPAWLGRTEKFYDFVGSLTFILVVLLGLGVAAQSGQIVAYDFVLAGVVCLWAVRLGSFLFKRVHQAGGDKRFDEIKISFPRFFMAWTAQALWVVATLLPSLILLTSKRPHRADYWMVIGLGMWLFGFVIEVIADRQKSNFRARNPSGDRWIEEGLWALSQHPNYFGEIVLWTGIFVAGIGHYQGAEWIAVVSPVFVFGLLTKGSGIPLLQERGEARWGDRTGYRSYREKTNLLVPLPRSSLFRRPGV
jgi:steroid 5-alpha reductase family enzyme